MARSKRSWSSARVLFALAIALVCGPLAWADTHGPEEVVKDYLSALKKGDYAAAYGVLTPYMVKNEDKDTWVREQTVMMQLAEAEIMSYEVFPAKVEGDKATVPNLLKSKDKFINQTGANEYELYTLVKSGDGSWKIDRQQLLETGAVEKWFPASAK
jgi:hypothetical protein